MFAQLLEVAMYTMALYGIISIIHTLMITLWNKMGDDVLKQEKIKLVLIVKNEEEAIEGIVRGFYIDSALERRIVANKGITILDMGSQDKTLEILQKLKNRYASLEILTIDDKNQIFEIN